MRCTLSPFMAAERTLRRIELERITLEVAVEGQGPLCVLVHGWPETWWSWRHQIAPLVGAGYQVAVPSVRGYAGSDAPEEVDAYSMTHLAQDVVGVIEALGHSSATLIGHDWGAPIVWHTALLHPDCVDAVVGMSVPHLGRGGPMPPTKLFEAMYPKRFFYVLYFQQRDAPEAEFEKDVRDSLSKIYYANSGDSTSEVRQAMRARTREDGYLTGLIAPDPLPAWLSQDDMDRYTADFERSGFRGGIHRYRCMDADWHAFEHLAQAKIQQPALFIAGEYDSVLRYAPGVNMLDMMAPFYADLRGQVIVPGAGHWVQQEQPGAVNRALLEFLAELR